MANKDIHVIRPGCQVRLKALGRRARETAEVTEVCRDGSVRVEPMLGGFHWWNREDLEFVPQKGNHGIA